MITAPRDLTVEQDPVERLRPDPANPRRISDAELESLTRSIGEFGFVEPVVARREDGVVIGGHQRLVAARRLGMTEVPIIWLDLPLEQARLLNPALNRISGPWDEQLLARLVVEAEAQVDLALTGFEDDELTDLLRSLDTREKRERPGTFDLEAALEAASGDSRTKPGDVWRLGEHRLICGDSTDAAVVERLLGDRTADMVFTDPPYDVGLGDHGGQGRGRRRRMANDAVDPAAWEAFVRGWATTLLASTAGAMYIRRRSQPAVFRGGLAVPVRRPARYRSITAAVSLRWPGRRSPWLRER